MCHKQLGVERTSLPYGFFDCWTRSGGGENALINYGILQTLFQGQRAVQSIQLSYLFCIHQFQPKFVNQCLQAGVTVNHPLKYHLRGVLHQKEVRNVQSSGTLFIGCHIFQYRTDRYGPADISKHGSLLLPLLRCNKVWHQYYIPMRQYTNGLFVETAVLSSSRQPQAVRHEVGCDECRLLAFHDENCLVGVADKKMFAKETLA